MKKINRLLISTILLFAISPAIFAGLPPGFVYENIDWVNGVGGAISMEFGPDQRLYVSQKNGEVVVYHRDASGQYGTPTSFASFTVNFALESGLLGLALDPDFATNRFMYVFYTTATDQRLLRVTASADYETMVPGSELILLQGLPNISPVHKAGDIHFRPGDNEAIYVAVGDDDIPQFSPDLNLYNGKILKINKATGQGFATNPYYNGDLDAVISKVWAYGHRNPFRFCFMPGATSPEVIYVSENGESIDRLSRVEMGADGDWGTGNNFTNVPDVRHIVMQNTGPSLIGIAIATSGPFADGPNPVLYLSNWLSGTRRYRLTGANLEVAEPMDNGAAFINTHGMDMCFGPDGALYLSKSGGDAGGDRIVHRIRFDGAIPTASFSMSPTPAVGVAPFTVDFTDSSQDSDGVISSWLWDFGDGAQSSAQNPQHIYGQDGAYEVSLTVTDDSGLSNTSAFQTVIVGDGCDNLDSIAETPSVNFGAQIEPILLGSCSSCHGTGGQSPDLSQNIEANLIGVSSNTPSWLYVDPGFPTSSLVFNKLNCAIPVSGARMPFGSSLSLTDQALIRDWIAQLPISGPTLIIRGDANADGQFNIADVIASLAFLFQSDALPCQQSADSNSDGALDISDAIWSLGAQFSGGPPPGDPFPACGENLSPGALSCDSFIFCN